MRPPIMSHPGRGSPVKEATTRPPHPGRESTLKEAAKASKTASSPKWALHLSKPRRKKRVATPHPIKIGGNSKRDALISLPETGRARKKIVFESEDPAAGINGGAHAHAGEGMGSSPSGGCEGGRRPRQARPGPFEAAPSSIARFEEEPGTLPLLARDLRFSMGKKDAKDQGLPECVAGTGSPGLAGARPEDACSAEMMAEVGDGRSLLVEKVITLSSMDEDTFPSGDGTNLLSKSTICATPFLEMPSHVLSRSTCDFLSQGGFKFEDGTSTLTKGTTMEEEADHDGEPSAPAPAPATSPEKRPETGEGSPHPTEQNLGVHGNSRAGVENGGAPKSAPVPLDVDHAEEMGTAGSCEGVPSLTFSNDETRLLAAKIGHAVIGKFSHTIPTTQQIQKSLSNIQFVDGFKWKFVNAKHILIQFRDVRDYGRMLNGPNGAPVWYIEHHPMRVFKWTPEFDTSFESPIAVVWCKVIGLPIHLYDQSALIAIGKLLGKPTQVDHATFDQTRLTYARICIEIDISSPPPDEIILNILGKDSRYKVVWDRIPTYCVECKHVGHVREECRVFGKKNPFKKGNNNQGARPHRDNIRRPHNRREWRPKGSEANAPTQQPDRATANKEEPKRGPPEENKAADASPSSKAAKVAQEHEDEEGFQLVTRRKKGNRDFPLHHTQDGPHEASYREKLLMGGNVATVTFGDTDMGVIDPGGSSTVYIN